MARVRLRNNDKDSNFKMNYNVTILELFIKYMRCEYVTRNDMLKLHKLLEYSEIDLYYSEPEIRVRLLLIHSLIDVYLNKGLQNDDLILNHLTTECPEGMSIFNEIGFVRNQLTFKECEHISKMITEKLKIIIIYKHKDDLMDIMHKFDDGINTNVSYEKEVTDIKAIIIDILSSLQDTTESQGVLTEFDFADDNAISILTKVLEKRRLPSFILGTGIRQLNAILSGGFKGSKLYVVVGGSGKFKSGTLLNLCEQIRLHNPQIIPYEDGFSKCILFITLENTIEESIERIFDMYSDMDASLASMSMEEIIEVFKSGSLMVNTVDNTNSRISIAFRYAGNLEISTADIYGMVEKLNSNGKKPIAIIVDYIKRIDSAHRTSGDEKSRISYVTKELKNIAVKYDIPLITAMQLNREGNSIIDAAMRENKQDVVRFVGSSSIGSAWEVIEDADWVVLINLEMQLSTNKLFLTFKRLKIREKKLSGSVDYFNHPFINAKNIRLMSDIDKPGPVSIISLANDLESIQENPDDNPKTTYRSTIDVGKENGSSRAILSRLRGSDPIKLLS